MKANISVTLILLVTVLGCSEERCREDGSLPENIFLEFRIINSDGENLLTGPFSDSGLFNVENIQIKVNDNVVEKYLDWTPSCSYLIGFKPFEGNFFENRADIFTPDSIPILLKLSTNDIDTLSMSYKIIDSGCGFYDLEKLNFWYNGDPVLYNDPCIAYNLIKK